MPLQLSSWPSSGPALNSICRRRLEATRQRTWLPVLYNLFLQVSSIHYGHKRKEGDHVQNSLMLCSSFCDKTRYSTVFLKIRNLVLGLSRWRRSLPWVLQRDQRRVGWKIFLPNCNCIQPSWPLSLLWDDQQLLEQTQNYTDRLSGLS